MFLLDIEERPGFNLGLGNFPLYKKFRAEWEEDPLDYRFI